MAFCWHQWSSENGGFFRGWVNVSWSIQKLSTNMIAHCSLVVTLDVEHPRCKRIRTTSCSATAPLCKILSELLLSLSCRRFDCHASVSPKTVSDDVACTSCYCWFCCCCILVCIHLFVVRSWRAQIMGSDQSVRRRTAFYFRSSNPRRWFKSFVNGTQ
jgi:hypothetical protein